MAALSPTRTIPAARQYVRDLWDRREFALYLAFANLRARNATTSLGLMWWVLNPLILGGIYALVFGIILQIDRGADSYVAYLLAGMFPFHYTRSAMVGGVASIISNTKLLANLHFPRLALPLSALIESAIGFAASLAVFYLVVGPMTGVWPSATVVWLVPAFAVHTVFNFGLAALIARIAVPFRDVNNLVPYVLRLWLYLSPIIYPISFLDELGSTARTLLELNPIFSILVMYRHALTGTPMDSGDVVTSVAWALIILVVGVLVFVRHESKMTRYL